MNRLTNWSFEDGHHHQDGVTELVVPDGWRLDFLEGKYPGDASPPNAARPESVVWNKKDAPENEKSIFFLDGDYCLKVFKAGLPVYFALSQHVTGLTPGTRYRFTAQVYPDLVKGYAGGKKVRPTDEWAGEARTGWSAPSGKWIAGREDGDIAWGDWFNEHSGNMAFGQYGDVWIEFVPTGDEVCVWLECKAKWGDVENNWFMDAFTLEAVGGEPEPPPVPEPPKPPEPEPPAPSGRGAPRMQYARTYVVLHPDADAEWAHSVIDATWADKRYTVGGSADDAGIGDLDERTVIAVNPEKWTGDRTLAQFFEEFYPGVAYLPVTAATPQELRDKLAGGLTPVPPKPPEPEPPPAPTGGEKISIHIQKWQDGVDEFIAHVKPAAVKLVLFMEQAYDIKALSPDTAVVYRQFVDNQGQYLEHPGGPAAGARAFLETFLDSLHHNADVIDYVEALNEPGGLECGNWNGIQNVVAFDLAFCEELEREGWPARPVLACAAVANPEHGPEIELLLPLARAVAEVGGALGPHTYWAVNPDLDYCSMTDGDWRHYAGRPLASWDATFTAAGVYPRYLFGEAGAIAISAPGGHMNSGAGWLHETCLDGDWDKYLSQIMEFRSRLTDRVIAATLFTITGEGDKKWKYFRFVDKLRALADALAGA